MRLNLLTRVRFPRSLSFPKKPFSWELEISVGENMEEVYSEAHSLAFKFFKGRKIWEPLLGTFTY
jgi:hypothetical protein